MVDPGQALDWVCQNEALVKPALIWAGGSLFASAAAWLSARFALLPPGAQRFLQLLAGNLLHAALGEPTPPAPPAAPPAAH